MEFDERKWRAALDGIAALAGSSSLSSGGSQNSATEGPDVPGDPTSGPGSADSELTSDLSSGMTSGPADDDWFPTTAGPDTPKDPNIFSYYATEKTNSAAAIGAIVGIVIAIVAVIVIFIILCCCREKIMMKICPEKSLVSDESGDEDDFEVQSMDVRSMGPNSMSGMTRRSGYSGFGTQSRSLVSSDGSAVVDTVSVDSVRREYSGNASPEVFVEY